MYLPPRFRFKPFPGSPVQHVLPVTPTPGEPDISVKIDWDKLKRYHKVWVWWHGSEHGILQDHGRLLPGEEAVKWLKSHPEIMRNLTIIQPVGGKAIVIPQVYHPQPPAPKRPTPKPIPKSQPRIVSESKLTSKVEEKKPPSLHLASKLSPEPKLTPKPAPKPEVEKKPLPEPKPPEKPVISPRPPALNPTVKKSEGGIGVYHVVRVLSRDEVLRNPAIIRNYERVRVVAENRESWTTSGYYAWSAIINNIDGIRNRLEKVELLSTKSASAVVPAPKPTPKPQPKTPEPKKKVEPKLTPKPTSQPKPKVEEIEKNTGVKTIPQFKPPAPQPEPKPVISSKPAPKPVEEKRPLPEPKPPEPEIKATVTSTDVEKAVQRMNNDVILKLAVIGLIVLMALKH